MMKRCCFTLVLSVLFFSLHGYAQSVTGRAVDSAGAPIVGVVVIADQTHATATDAEGHFDIDIDRRPYTLVFRHVSYDERTVTDSADDLGDVVLEEVAIDGVVVRGRRPVVTVEEGKMVYDVRQLSEGKVVTNAFDAIAQLPTVSSSGDRLGVVGVASGTTVIINGKPSVLSGDQLAQLLKSTPVERLEKVETSYSAPPSWHAVGAAINIVLKYDPDQRNGQLQAGYNHLRHTDLYNLNGNLYVAGKRLSADVVAGYRAFGGFGRSYSRNEHIVQDVVHEVTQNSTNKGTGNGITLYGSLGYRLKGSNSLRFTYFGDLSPRKSGSTRTQGIPFGNEQGNSKGNWGLHGMTLSYESETIGAGVSYTRYDDRNRDRITDGTRDFDSDIRSENDRFGAYADLSHTLPHAWTLSYGARFNLMKSRSHQTTNIAAPSKGALDEYNADAYIGVSRTFKGGIYFSVDLRGDYYGVKGYHKYSFLPSLSLTYPITDNHKLQYSLYTSRDYPSYGMQREYSYYQDSYTLRMGNPAIRPATSYVGTLSYILKNRYVFSFRYNHTDNDITSERYMSPDELLALVQPYNQRLYTSITLSASIPVTLTKWWRIQLQALGRRVREKADDWHGISYDLSHFNAQVAIDNYITISSEHPQIQLTFGGYYGSSAQMGIDKMDPVWAANVGGSYVFAGKRAVLAVNCYDIFESSDAIYRSLIVGQKRYGKQLSFRSFNVSFTWKFGNYNGTRMRTGEMDASRALQ